MSRLKDKVAIITGMALGGTGHGLATAFLKEGAKLVVSDIDRGSLADAITDLEPLGDVTGLVGDAGDREQADRTVRAAIQEYGRLDILVNNAAVSTPGVLLENIDDVAIASTLGASLYATLYHMQAAFPHMRERGGSILNFGSRNGIVGAAGFSLYAAAKEGIRGLSRSASREWGRHGIRVNVLCPATLSPGAKAYLEKNPAEAAMVQEVIALGYIGDAIEDVAPVAVFLASDEGRYVTGQTINVDGGQVML